MRAKTTAPAIVPTMTLAAFNLRLPLLTPSVFSLPVYPGICEGCKMEPDEKPLGDGATVTAGGVYPEIDCNPV